MDQPPPALVKYWSTRSLRARGWTDSLIRLLLIGPDKYAANPYFWKNGGRMKLWNLDRVLEAEADSRFQLFQIQRARRKEAAQNRRLATHE